MTSLDVVYLDSPFKVSTLPLDKVYVIDNYLDVSLHHSLDDFFTRQSHWAKTNQVNGDNPTGLPHHSFWGASFLTGVDEHADDSLLSILPKWFNRRLQTDFQFKWERFQYMGLNSQTQGLHGTTHSDCKDEDEWNLSFLYYYNKFWNPSWGGYLRFYDAPQQGLEGRDEHIKNHQIAEVEFKPNRLLMFDGRIPHGADAPKANAHYMDRRSVVVRGDEVRLVNNEEMFRADDRIHLLR